MDGDLSLLDVSQERSKSKSSSKAKPKAPSDSEYLILRVLWKKGPSTLRQIHQEIGSSLSYGSVTKFLNIMKGKGLVEADEQPYAWVYRATQSQETVQRGLISALIEKAFEGSPLRLITQALASKKPSPKDLETIRRLCDE